MNRTLNWLKESGNRVKTSHEAARLIHSNMRIFLSGNCSVPRELVAALVQNAPHVENVEIVQVLTFGSADYVVPDMEKHLRVNTLFISENVRAAVNAGRADFTPCFLSEIPNLFSSGRLPIEIALIQVSPPDEHGYCSLGVEVGVTKAAAIAAKMVIAEVNPRMPRTLGDSFIHISKLDVIVPVNYALPEVHMSDGNDEITDRIAEHVATLIPDAATLQVGIGGIPDAVLRKLGTHKDLGIHTELFSDGIIDLVERGIINGEKKTLHYGKIVAGFILGSQRLYEYVHDNPIFEMHPTEYVNDPFIIAQNDNMVAINSAIEVDLTGQVCADSIGPRPYSGVGGQIDFIYGSARARGGLPIIALPSTLTKNGARISRIAAMLKEGAGVTTTRSHVHFVVTEHGVADLYGRSIRQRARALIGIASPEFREDLTKQAKALNYL